MSFGFSNVVRGISVRHEYENRMYMRLILFFFNASHTLLLSVFYFSSILLLSFVYPFSIEFSLRQFALHITCFCL